MTHIVLDPRRRSEDGGLGMQHLQLGVWQVVIDQVVRGVWQVVEARHQQREGRFGG